MSREMEAARIHSLALLAARRAGWILLSGLVVLAQLGCSSSKSKSASKVKPRDGIEEINMFCAPAALEFDGMPGADGISLRIYAANPTRPRTMQITEGTLEILLFEGLLKGDSIRNAKPDRVWSYPASELAARAQKMSVGMSYSLTPQWGKERPAKPWITVVARYIFPDGRTLYTGPATIFVTSQ